MKKNVLEAIAVCAALTMLHGCAKVTEQSAPPAKAPALKTPTAIILPQKYNSPDGMVIGKDNCIYLSMNNVGDPSQPAKVLKIKQDNTMEEVITLTPDPETKVASPLGIAFGSDGNLYIADNQSFATNKPNMARLFRVVMKDGKAERCEVVARGFNMSNAVACRGNDVYVTETNLGTPYPLKSGVYRFSIAELSAEKPITVTGLDDPHLILNFETQNKEYQVGANGMCFDSKGNLYVCNFGDAEVYKFTLDSDGKVTGKALMARGQGMMSCDGMHEDADDNLWVADFIGNAVVKIDTKTGIVTTVAKNAPGDGANGELDAPSECIRRGNTLYVSNIDLTYGPNKSDNLHSMSVIKLDE